MLASKVLPCVWNLVKRMPAYKRLLKRFSKFKRAAGYKKPGSLQFWKLSRRAQKLLIEKMPMKKIFFLLATSPKFERLYKRVNETKVTIILQMMDSVCSVLVSAPGSGQSCVFALSTDRSQVTWHEWSQEEKIRLGGGQEDVIVNWKEDLSHAVQLYHSDLPTLVGRLTAFLFRVFKHKFSIGTNLSQPSQWMHRIPHRRTSKLYVYARSIGASELEFLLTRFPPSDLLTMTSHITGPLPAIDSVYRHFHPDTLQMHAPWLTMENLLQMGIRYGYFQHTRFTTAEVMGFVRRWLRSNDRSTRMLTFHNHPACEIDFLRISDEFDEARPWDPAKRDGCTVVYNKHANDPLSYMNLESWFDVERSDGLLATFIVFSHFFRFIVWHDRFPRSDRELKKAVELEIEKNGTSSLEMFLPELTQYFH